MVWKYLLVVATSCALAFVISQNDADAQTADAKAPAAAPAIDYAAKGAFAVKVTEQVWRDDARKRDVPVKIYSPQSASDTSSSSRFPVVLFSHGLGGNRDGGRLWAEHWASHGYVVVAMQHAGSDESLWKGKPPREIVTSMKAGMTLNNLGLRVNDVKFAIDEIIRRTAAMEREFINADAKRIGMSGHSFGAQTTLAVSGQKAPTLGGQAGIESRIVSSIAFSPNARNKMRLAQQFGDIRIPFMSITGTEDGSILEDDTQYQHRMLPYENMPAGGKYLVVFDGGDHMVFGGHELGGRRKETGRDREIQADVKAGTLAFWNATLKSDTVAEKWLAASNDAGYKSVLAAKDTFAAK
jgi:predicted dienelactone hydrolase